MMGVVGDIPAQVLLEEFEELMEAPRCAGCGHSDWFHRDGSSWAGCLVSTCECQGGPTK